MNVAFIPVRGGSKSIPLKNIKKLAGQPLVYWAIKAACGCEEIHKVYVATDSEDIRNAIYGFVDSSRDDEFAKLCVIGRSKESATDEASTESAMLEFAAKYDFDNIVLIQATSPLLEASDLTRGFREYSEDNVDSVLSVVRQKRFNWQADASGMAKAVNYDYFKRPRRQEFDGYLVENGAFYITSRKCLLKYKNRISGNIKAVEMDEATYFEIDEPSDWLIIEKLLKQRIKKQPFKGQIRMLLTDCDGCLTDGGMYYSENGDELKKFNTRDGMAFKLLREKNILTGIVTGETTELVRRRSDKLKLDILELGCMDKLAAVKKICQEYDIALSNVLYIGDDINDLDLLRKVGYACAPADAVQEVKENVDYISVNGGSGVIRDVYEHFIANKENR